MVMAACPEHDRLRSFLLGRLLLIIRAVFRRFKVDRCALVEDHAVVTAAVLRGRVLVVFAVTGLWRDEDVVFWAAGVGVPDAAGVSQRTRRAGGRSQQVSSQLRN